MLNDIELNNDLLNQFGFNLEIISSNISNISIKIPWKSLNKDKIVLEIKDL
jgi:hypothetical protein